MTGLYCLKKKYCPLFVLSTDVRKKQHRPFCRDLPIANNSILCILSNPAQDMDSRLFYLLCCVASGLGDGLITGSEECYSVCVCVSNSM